MNVRIARRECPGPTATTLAGGVDARPYARGKRRNPSPSASAEGLFVFRVRRVTRERTRVMTQDSDHQCPSLHQRRQAPRQPRRLAAAGRRACPLPPPGRRRGAVHLRHRRARHAGRARRDRGRPGRPRLLRRAARDPGRHLSPLRPLVRSFRPHLRAAEPRADAALLPPARRRGPDRGAQRAAGVVARQTGASCPTATCSAPVRSAAPRLRAATSATIAARCSTRPISSARARRSPARPTSSCAKAATCSCASPRWSSASMHGSTRAAAGRRSWCRSRKAGSPRTCATAASRAISPGACRCRGRDSRARCSMSGSMRRSATSRRRRNGPSWMRAATGAIGGSATMSATSSSSARTTCRSTP